MANWRSLGLGVCLAMAVGASAQAAVTVSSAAGAPDPGYSAAENRFITFDSGLEAGVTLTGGQIVTGSVENRYAAPAGGSTAYLAVGSNGAETAFLDFASLLGTETVRNFSFYWGSIDTFNTLELVNRAGQVLFTFSGSQLPPATGDWTAAATNRRVTFDLTGADTDLAGLRFTSTTPSFELDSIGLATAVPEPAVWSMMVSGFMVIGGMLRRRRTVSSAA